MTIVASVAAPAVTGGSLVKAAYQMIGYLGSNETMSGAAAALGLKQINFMLGSWSNENLATYAILEQNFVLMIGQNAYTIGTSGGASIPQVRPIRLIEGSGAAYLQDTNANNYRVDVVTREQWNQIANRGVMTTSNIPDTLFYDPQFPLGVINIWPTPISAYTLFFDSFQQIAEFANLAQVVSLPPGYNLAIQANLAIIL